MRISNINCPNCGANLEINENKRYTKCQYCNTNLSIEKDINAEIKANILNTSKVIGKIFPMAFILIFVIVIIITSLTMFSFIKHNSNWDINSFNNSFTYAAGTKTKIFVDATLDDVIKSNKNNIKHQIYVKYNNTKTNKEKEIVSIKDSLNNYDKYEVSIDYDSDGYVNLVTIIKK